MLIDDDGDYDNNFDNDNDNGGYTPRVSK